MNELINLIICVDDTDDLTKSTSTGAVAERILQVVKDCGGLIDLDISRHQLLIHEDVNYTSHNSSMAFSARISEDALDEIYPRAVDAIEEMKAESADPGLCIVVVPRDDYDEYEGIRALIDFGQRAKVQVCTMDDAYCVASRIPWVSLTEHGGTGEGVIGALAGAGLRLSGCDGRFRGKWNLEDLCYEGENAVTNAKGLREQEANATTSTDADSDEILTLPAGKVLDVITERVNGMVSIVDLDGKELDPTVPMALTYEVKPVLFGNAFTIVTEERDGVAWPCSKVQLEESHSGFDDMNRSCSLFEPDNDDEEMAGADESAPICANCLYRRWVPQGFACMKRGR